MLRSMIIPLSLVAGACATPGPVDLHEAQSRLKTGLVEGENLILANACTRYAEAQPVSVSQPIFGSCYLTSLRFIFEESAWAKALATAARFVPTGGDFGLAELASGAIATVNAYTVLERGRDGELRAVERDGRALIPLPALTGTDLRGKRSDMANASVDGERWLTLATETSSFVFEIYDLPPDKTTVLPPLVGARWRQAVEKLRSAALNSPAAPEPLAAEPPPTTAPTPAPCPDDSPCLP